MKVDYPYLVAGVLLLWLPRSYLRFGRIWTGHGHAAQLLDDPDFNHITLKNEVRNLRNWVDFLRAGTGAYAVCHMAVLMPENVPVLQHWPVIFVHAAVVTAGVLLQSYRCIGGQVLMFAPLFYMIGVVGGVAGLLTGMFALITMLVFTSTLRMPLPWLGFLALLSVLYGIAFHADHWRALLGALIVVLPVLLSLLFKKNMRLYSKRLPHKRGRHSGAPK